MQKVDEMKVENKVVEKIDNVVGQLNKTLWSLSGIILMIIGVSVCYDVFTRFVLNYSNEWVGEYAGYMYVCITFMAAPYTLYVGGMTKVDLIVNALKPMKKWLLTIFTSLLSLFYLGVLFRMSYNLVFRSFIRDWRSATQLRTPLWIPQMAIPIGAILMFLSVLTLLIKIIITGPEKTEVKKLTEEELVEKAKKDAREEAGGGAKDIQFAAGKPSNEEER